jgi:hypothetical protein
LSPVCAGITRDGNRCTVGVPPGVQWCYNHDPSRSEERKRAASRAGKSKPSCELQSVKTQLQELADNVLTGEVDRADAAVCGQLLNVLLRALEAERKVREVEQVEERLVALEELASRASRRKGSGARAVR